METLFTFTSPPGPCGYLPDRHWQMRYELVREMTPDDYLARMNQGWRRFGHSIFRPECPSCRECRPLRIPTRTFVLSRTQSRVLKANSGQVDLQIGRPQLTPEMLALYAKYHEFQSAFKGWPDHRGSSAADYIESFIDNPFPTEEWRYTLDGRLVGVGYVDVTASGLSAIYFYYDPVHRDRSLGTWNVLSVLQEAVLRQLDYVYLGFFVKGCRSLEYKATYQPNELLDAATGEWKPFRDRNLRGSGEVAP